MTARTEATLDDLYHVEGKAELVNGEIVQMPPTGIEPSRIGFRITAALMQYEEETGRGFAVPDNAAFVVKLPHRQSFSPDAAYTFAPMPTNPMRFQEGAPTFAVEVRSEGDYGATAERVMAAKRRDYFDAGTRVVWDVDPVGHTVAKYAGDAETPAVTFGMGETAEAEPALPGWRMAVDAIFR